MVIEAKENIVMSHIVPRSADDAKRYAVIILDVVINIMREKGSKKTLTVCERVRVRERGKKRSL